MNTTQFRWLWTALITPFKEGDWIHNEIDYDALEKVLQMQIDGGVDWILLLGTTAERPTFTEEEEIELIKFAIKFIAWRTKIMVNAGTYSTMDSLKTISYLDELEWIDCYLVVNPYYNKPTQTWLKKHFITSAKATKRPIFLYNIQGRTWVNLETETLLEIIKEAQNIIWVKEASWNIEQIKEVIEKTPDDFLVLSWDDALTYDLAKLWWDWVISVASNCIPEKMKEFVDICLKWEEKASELNDEYSLFFDKLFIQTNPLPAKTFLATKGIIKEEFRLPICRMDSIERQKFLDIIENLPFIK
jgi:4-hydroxy-tetrahydrodipicolinate synthase